MPRRLIVSAIILCLLVLGIGTYSEFQRELSVARSALGDYVTARVETGHGPVEFMDGGTGIPVLSIHGTGGGFDQGWMLGEPFVDAGFRVIAPSRFGYLGTPVPADSSAPAQADAFAELLDALEIERVVVMGASAGAITALHFAARHPDRTLALLPVVPAYYPPGDTVPEPWSPLKRWALTEALQSDFLFWAAMQTARVQTASAILATDRALIENASPEEHARLMTVFEMILPISARAEGLMLDTANTALPVEVDLGAITAPTLAISAEDDHYRTADAARLIAASIPGAELLVFPDGGHAFANRQAELNSAVEAFLTRVLPR